MKEARLKIGLMGLVLCSGSAWADYQCEVGGSYLFGSMDSTYSPPSYQPPVEEFPPGETPILPPTLPSVSSDEDFDGFGVSGTWFFEPVDTSNGPLRLAPFLSRASGISGSYGRYETDESDIEVDFWNAEVRWLVSDAWVVEAGLGGSESDDSIVDAEVDLLHAAVGYYVGQNTEVKVGFNREDAEVEEYDRWSVQIEHVQTLENGVTWQARGLLGLVKGDHDTFSDADGADWEAAVSVYFTPRFGIGFDYQVEDHGDAGETDFHRAWASYLPSDKVVLELAYYGEENDDVGIDSDGVVFSARYRW